MAGNRPGGEAAGDRPHATGRVGECRSSHRSDDPPAFAWPGNRDAPAGGESGGNVRAPSGTEIEWLSKGEHLRFKLEFFIVAMQTPRGPINVRALDPWPFEDEAQPKWPVNKFVGKLKKPVPDTPYLTYKYYVTVGTLRLDPIIIVDD